MAANLQSNDGTAQITVELSAPAEYAHDAGFESAIRLSGQHWDGDHLFPFSTSIAGLWLRKEDITVLREHISQWVRRPLDRLVAQDLNADFELARLPGQRVLIRFGGRTDTVSDSNPVVTIEFSAGAFHGEYHFVTDQSCLSLFAHELSAELVG